MRKIIAKTTTFDAIRNQNTVITVFEEKYVLGYFYTVNVDWEEIGNEENGRFHSYEFDTMGAALEFAAAKSGNVMPTNGNVPAFPVDE